MWTTATPTSAFFMSQKFLTQFNEERNLKLNQIIVRTAFNHISNLILMNETTETSEEKVHSINLTVTQRYLT